MEKKYRELFDEVHASAKLRMEVMNMTEKRRAHGLRTVLAAALAAAVLTGTVLAVGAASGFDIVRFFNGEERVTAIDENGEQQEYGLIYEIGTEGMTFFPEADMSEEYRTVVREGTSAQAIPRSGSGVYLNMPNWKAAEEFLGLELANSQVLEEQGKLVPQWRKFGSISSDTVELNVLLDIHGNGHNSVQANFQAFKPIEGGEINSDWINLNICILTDAVAPDMRDNSWLSLVQNPDIPHDESENAREDYVTAGGLEATIIKRKGDTEAEDFTKFDGIFVLNGMGYRLTTDNEAFLKEVLDGFQ